MKKVFSFVAVAMLAVAVLSSCNSPKLLAKRMYKCRMERKDASAIIKKVNKLSDAEAKEYFKELEKLDEAYEREWKDYCEKERKANSNR